MGKYFSLGKNRFIYSGFHFSHEKIENFMGKIKFRWRIENR